MTSASLRVSLIAYRLPLFCCPSQHHPDASNGKQTDEDAQSEVQVLARGLAGRLGKINAAAAKEGVERMLALQHEISDRTMKQGDDQPKYQPGEVHHHHAFSF